MSSSIRLFIVIILLIFYPSLVLASQFSFVPSLSVKEEYNSNILLLTDSAAESDFITTISPSVEMVNRTEQFDIDLLARWDRLEYANNSDISATNQIYDGKFHYSVNPLFNVSAEAGYTRYSNPTLMDITTTGIFMEDVPWNHFTSSLSADYQITEKTTATVSYAYGRDYFESPRYVDDTSHDVNLGIVYDLGKYSPTMKVMINGDYSYYYLSSDIRIDNFVGTVGFSKNLNETWSILVNGGVRHTRSEISAIQYQLVWVPFPPFGYIGTYIPVKVEQDNYGWGWVGKASLIYKGEYGNVNFSYVRDITPAYGLDGAAEQNAFTLSTQYRFTNELSVLFSAGYYTIKSNPSEFSAQAINQRTFGVNPGVRYEFSKDIFVEASYEYLTVDYLAAENMNAKRDLFSIRLYIQYPFFSRTN